MVGATRTIIIYSDKKTLAGATAKSINIICNNSLQAVTALGKDQLFGILREIGFFDIPPHILARFSHLVTPQWVIQSVRELRQSLGWEGGFVAVMRSKENHLELNKTCLFGETDVSFPYPEVPGHFALSEPVQLPLLFSSISEIKEMSAETWGDLLDKSELGSIQKIIINAVDPCEYGKADNTIDIVQEVILKILKINWPMLVAHEDMLVVNNILKNYSCDSVRTSLDYDNAIRDMQHLLELAGIK
jgi:hypothetical protein